MKRSSRLVIVLTAAAVFAMAAALMGATVPHAQAQPAATSAPTAAGSSAAPQSSVQGFFVACETGAVMNLTGTMLAGWDVYYQVFAGPSASGTALTSLRQVQVGGDFRFSEQVSYTSGATVPAGQSASARVLVARESNSASVDFSFNLTDVQDGCSSPQNPPGTSVDSGTASSTNPALINLPAPNGGVLNPNLAPEATVVIGPRPSDSFRSQTPGLIYAACENFALALPGLIYDSDPVTVYWSWYTRTEAQMQQHLANAQYSVRMNGASFNDVVQSAPQRLSGLYYVFYTFNVGNLRPGHYEVEYRLTWANPVNDGFADFGPGTANPADEGNCNFDITRNPTSQPVSYTNMFNPAAAPWHNITPNN